MENNELDINSSNYNKISALNKNDSGFSEITTNSLNMDGNLENTIDGPSLNMHQSNGTFEISRKNPMLEEINENSHKRHKLSINSPTINNVKKSKRLTDVESIA